MATTNDTVKATDNNTYKYIYEWVIPFEKEVTETIEETRNGQPVKVTQTVRKEVPVKMAMKRLTRREQRESEEFYGVEYNRYWKMGFLPRQVVLNTCTNISGGLISEKEREEIARLMQKRNELELDISRAVSSTDEIRKELQAKLYAVTSKIMEFNNANEQLFAQTAEAKAQNQLQSWLAFNMILIEKDGKYVPYFEGETFKQQEEFLFKLEESREEFYQKAVEKIAFYLGLFVRGIDKPEQFELIEKEMAEQLKAKMEAEKAELEKAITAAEAEAKVTIDANDPAIALANDAPTSYEPEKTE